MPTGSYEPRDLGDALLPRRAALDDLRQRYAELITSAGWVTDPRIERAFATIPREAFLPPPPWRIFPPGGAEKTPASDPAKLYDDVLVVLDAQRGVNNGQPSLHAAWLAAVDPKPGDTAVHIGAGTGYYTAILSLLVLPGGRVHAYEIDERLALLAERHLAPFEHVTLHAGSGLETSLPEADVVYVNAGLAAPDPAWLRALRPGGRLIFPWQPLGPGGVALLVTRDEGGFRARATMQVSFVSCERAEPPRSRHLDWEAVERTRSVWLTAVRAPDETATAVYDAVWFSADEIRPLN